MRENRPSLEALEQRTLLDATGFVSGLYRSFLHREPEAEGLAHHVRLLASGVTEDAVIKGFTISPEYLTTLARRAFHDVLEREPDAGALAGLVTALRNGLTDAQMRENLLAADEFFSNHGGAARGFVAGVYQAELRRGPGGGEDAPWVAQLASGVSRAAVAHGIAASHEAHALVVDDSYQRLLGRHAEDG